VAEPAKNPFPRQATVALETMLGADALLPTIAREPIVRLTRLSARYLAEPGDERIGRAVVLHGDHGTGKTHTLLVALERIQGRPFVLYARADAPDAQSLYRRLLRPVTRGELRELVTAAFARYAIDAFESERGRPLTAEAAQRLREEPSLVFEAIRNQELSLTGLIGRQERDLARIEGSGNSFERVVRAVLDPDRGEAAHAWLTGAEVDPEDLSRLGAHANITGVSDVRMAIHVLAVLSQRAGRPFVLALDQAEVFLQDPDGVTLDRRHVGMLRDVVEDIPLASGFLVVSMNEPVWRALPRDVKQRFGPSEIVARALTLGEADAIVRAYLQLDAAAPLPFDPSAVRRLLAATAGNLRRFLQGCHVAFAARPDGTAPITSRSVDTALEAEAATVAPGETEVFAVVRRLLRRPGWSVGDEAAAAPPATLTARHHTGRTIAVVVAGAVYEAGDAERLRQRVDEAERADPRPAATIVVVTGYVSPDVIDRLPERTAVLIAANDGLEHELGMALDKEVAAETAASRELDRQLHDLRTEIERFTAGREQETEVVAARIREVLAEQDARRRLDQLRLSRLAWAEEQQRVTDAIAAARRDREQAEIDEIRELADAYDRERDRRTRLGVALAVAVIASAAVALVAVLTTWADVGLSSSALGVAALAVAALTTTVYSFSISRPATPHGRMRSVEDLARAARSVVPSPRSAVRPDLRSRNPYRRYAAALRSDGESPALSLTDLVAAAVVEPSALIRRRLVSAALRRGAPAIEALLRSDGESSALSLTDLVAAAVVEPSALIRRRLVSAALRRGAPAIEALLRSELDVATLSVAFEAAAEEGYDPETLRLDTQPMSLRALAALYWVIANESAFIERFLALVSRGSVVVNPRAKDVDAALARAFLTEDDDLLLDAVPHLRERDLQRGLDALSPFGRTGLGAFYWLRRGELISDVYVFLRKAAFMIGRGLDRPEPPSAA
jgi:hypothetical protein